LLLIAAVLLLLLLVLLLLLLLVAAAETTAAVGEILQAVGSKLSLLDGLVIRILDRLDVVRGVHHVEVVIADEDHGTVVGRDRCPCRFAGRPLFQQRELAACEFVLISELLLIAARRRRVDGGAAPALLLRLGEIGLFFLLLLLLLSRVALSGDRGI